GTVRAAPGPLTEGQENRRGRENSALQVPAHGERSASAGKWRVKSHVPDSPATNSTWPAALRRASQATSPWTCAWIGNGKEYARSVCPANHAGVVPDRLARGMNRRCRTAALGQDHHEI